MMKGSQMPKDMGKKMPMKPMSDKDHQEMMKRVMEEHKKKEMGK